MHDGVAAKRRRQLSLVGQQVNLFDASVADNIRFGWPDAEEDVREAARQAHALEFVEALPNGFDTQIGPFEIDYLVVNGSALRLLEHS